MSHKISLKDFVDLSLCLQGERFNEESPFAYVGKSLRGFLSELLHELGVRDEPVVKGTVMPGAILQGAVYVAEGATIEPTAFVKGPTYIGPGAEVRHGAYVRGDVYIGAKAVVGHASEVKGSVLFDGAKAAHFAYVGDAVLGRNVNLGAGTKLANLALKRGSIKVFHPDTKELQDTNLTKFSAIIGDNAQTGCNAVLSPGTLLYPGTIVGPCAHFRGTLTKGIAR